MADTVSLRVATAQDVPALLAIYTPYVETTAISFEYEAPSEAEFTRRMENILQKYPYLVAEVAGEIVGYAYAGAFKERAAYSWAAESTLYVAKSFHGRGVGRALYTALENILTAQGVLSMNACIAHPEKEDEYLSENSLKFHQRLGFILVGEFHSCGYKFSRRYNMVWVEKQIGTRTATPLPIKPFPEVRELIFENYGIK